MARRSRMVESLPVNRTSQIDLNLLLVFNAIYTSGGVTTAARDLRLTQSTISHALARLRLALGDPLFVRTAGVLVPTPVARALIEPIRSSLRGIDVALAGAACFDQETSDRLFRIGLRPATETRLFASLVALCSAAAPRVRLASVAFRRSDLERSLGQGDFDIALDIRSRATGGLRSFALHADRLVVAARPGGAFATGASDLRAYLNADHVVVSQRPAGTNVEDEVLAALGLSRRIAVRCQDVWSAWGIVAGSERILSLSNSEASNLQALARLHLTDLPFECVPSTLNVYWHPIADCDPGHVWLRSLVHQTLTQD